MAGAGQWQAGARPLVADRNRLAGYRALRWAGRQCGETGLKQPGGSGLSRACGG